MIDLQAAIRAAAERVANYYPHSPYPEDQITETVKIITDAIMPAVEKQAEIIKHMIEDQCELEKQLETLVGSTAQGDEYHMESIYDVVKRRWDELTAQSTIERAAHKTACEAVEKLKQERDEQSSRADDAENESTALAGLIDDLAVERDAARAEAAALRLCYQMVVDYIGDTPGLGHCLDVEQVLVDLLSKQPGQYLLDELQRLRVEVKQLRGEA